MKKKLITALFLIIVLLTCACGKSSSSDGTEPEATETVSAETQKETPSKETQATESQTTETLETVTTTDDSSETTSEEVEETTEETTAEEDTEPDGAEDDASENAEDQNDDGQDDSSGSRSVSTDGYSVDVNLSYGCVTIYYDGEPVRAMRCSVGTSGGCETVVGDFTINGGSEWMYMEGDVWAQYATRFYGPYLFHSVPYYSQYPGDLEYEDYNKLGSPASLGCVRLCVADARWIYYNLPNGTPVHTFYDESGPGPLGKPGGYWVPTDIVELRGWDPTDPDERNPWPAYYVDITAPDITIITGDSSTGIFDEVTVEDRYGNDVSGYASFSDSVDTSEPGTYIANISVSIGGYYYTETSFTVTVEGSAASEGPAASDDSTDAPSNNSDGEDTSPEDTASDETGE